jgi:hypothetical protein
MPKSKFCQVKNCYYATSQLSHFSAAEFAHPRGLATTQDLFINLFDFLLREITERTLCLVDKLHRIDWEGNYQRGGFLQFVAARMVKRLQQQPIN